MTILRSKTSLLTNLPPRPHIPTFPIPKLFKILNSQMKIVINSIILVGLNSKYELERLSIIKNTGFWISFY